MVKTKGRKNESLETGLDASSTPDLEAPESDDRSEDEPSKKTVLTAIAALSTEVNLIRSEICAVIENRFTEVSDNQMDPWLVCCPPGNTRGRYCM